MREDGIEVDCLAVVFVWTDTCRSVSAMKSDGIHGCAVVQEMQRDGMHQCSVDDNAGEVRTSSHRMRMVESGQASQRVFVMWQCGHGVGGCAEEALRARCGM